MSRFIKKTLWYETYDGNVTPQNKYDMVMAEYSDATYAFYICLHGSEDTLYESTHESTPIRLLKHIGEMRVPEHVLLSFCRYIHYRYEEFNSSQQPGCPVPMQRRRLHIRKPER